jgi:hypothetical protein
MRHLLYYFDRPPPSVLIFSSVHFNPAIMGVTMYGSLANAERYFFKKFGPKKFDITVTSGQSAKFNGPLHASLGCNSTVEQTWKR